MSKFKRIPALGILAALAVGTLSAAPAYAKGTVVKRAGTCTASTRSKIKLSNSNGRIEADFEVDSNRNRQVWNVSIRDNGVRVFSGTRTTQAPSGSFTVTRRIPNRAGIDHVVASAKNAKTGESCVARASI